MSKSAGNQSDDFVKLGVRIPRDLLPDFDRVRGGLSHARAGTDAIILWMALPVESRGILAVTHEMAEKRKYAAELAARLMRPTPAELVDAVEARQQGRKRTGRRNSA